MYNVMFHVSDCSHSILMHMSANGEDKEYELTVVTNFGLCHLMHLIHQYSPLKENVA